MTAQTTTGIVLRQFTRTGEYQLTRDGGRAVLGRFPHDRALDQIAWAAGLRDGYWLRDTPQMERRDGKLVMVATVWTWMQL